MIELPETYVLANQINKTLVGKKIKKAVANASPHKFAWYSGDPDLYNDLLAEKVITMAYPGTKYTSGGCVEIVCDDMLLVITTPIKYHKTGEKLPSKHQLWLLFDDESSVTCTIQMWGCMFCYKANENGLPQGYKVNKSPTPLEETFDKAYFDKLLNGVKRNLSAKAFLATEQRIPGLGNGVAQDILFNTKIHPKSKLENLTSDELDGLYNSVKETLLEMAKQGGRDTEKDLFGNSGGYKTILSAKTAAYQCPECGSGIIREVYLGGNIYYCSSCQVWKK